MSLLDGLVSELRKHVPQAQAGIDKGLESGIQRAREWVATHPQAGNPEMREAMAEALDRVELAAPSLAHLAGHNLVAVLSLAFDGRGADDDVRSSYFQTELGYEERRKHMRNRTLAKAERQLAKEESWDDFKDLLGDLGQLALRAIVPVLLAAI